MVGNVVDLSGIWRFKLDPEDMGSLYRHEVVWPFQDDCQFFEADYDDSHWDEIKVPACWQAEDYDYNGVAWYRRRFVLPVLQRGKTARLRFKGVDYFCDAWLNGFYLGSHEGYFAPFEYDVTDKLVEGVNVLAVRVDSPNDVNVKSEVEHREKTLIKGALQDWDANNPQVNPAGIWNDVDLAIAEDLYVTSLKVTPQLDDGKAVSVATVGLYNRRQESVDCMLLLKATPANFEGPSTVHSQIVRIRPGASQHEIWLGIRDPQLWWTWDLGKPNLYELEVILRAGERVLDEVTTRFGLRKIEKGKGWATYLNGQRIFWRGTNYLSDQLLSTMDKGRYRRDVQLMREANMNMVRAFCVVEKEDFYDLCDEMGILIYQDFPMQWQMSDSGHLVRRALRQVREMIDLLYNHPCVAIWCAGSEPGEKNFKKLGMALADECRRVDRTRLVQQANEWPMHWDILALKDKYKWEIDFHFYAGWYASSLLLPAKAAVMAGDTVFDLNKYPKEFFEVVSEYGAQSLPSLDSLQKFISEKDLWPPNWRVFKNHCCQTELLLRVAGEPRSIEDLIAHTQEYQAFFLKYHTEFYRKLKFQPCNGALQFLFNDCWPAITWSVVDYYRELKRGYFSLKQAFNPIHVMMDWPEDTTRGRECSWTLFVVNDYAHAYHGLGVEWKVVGQHGESLVEGVVQNAVPPNSLLEAGKIHWTAEAPGGYRVELTLKDGDQILSRNEYAFEVR